MLKSIYGLLIGTILFSAHNFMQGMHYGIGPREPGAVFDTCKRI